MQVSEVDVTFASFERQFVFSTDTTGIVRLVADDGTTGIGEIPDIEELQEGDDPTTTGTDELSDPEAVEEGIGTDPGQILELLEPRLSGRDPRRINHIVDSLEGKIPLRLLKGVDTALYDLVGNAYRQPVYQLLGGKTNPVNAAWVAYTRHQEDELEGLEAEIRECVDAGFDAFKIKVGDLDPAVEAQRIQTVRDIAGDDATIMLDARALYTVDEAIENIRRFESIGIDAVETPVGHPDPDVEALWYKRGNPVLPEEIRQVRDAVDTPIMEHVFHADFALELLEADAVDVFVVTQSDGGIAYADRLLDIAYASGVEARLSTTVETELGALAAVALGASSPAVTYPCDINGPAIYADSPLQSPVEYQDGTLSPREAPGFGIDLKPGFF